MKPFITLFIDLVSLKYFLSMALEAKLSKTEKIFNSKLWKIAKAVFKKKNGTEKYA